MKTRKKVIAIGVAILAPLLTSFYLHFLGSDGKAMTCIGHNPNTTFFQCVKTKMCEKGHLPFSTCHPPQSN